MTKNERRKRNEKDRKRWARMRVMRASWVRLTLFLGPTEKHQSGLFNWLSLDFSPNQGLKVQKWILSSQFSKNGPVATKKTYKVIIKNNLNNECNNNSIN